MKSADVKNVKHKLSKAWHKVGGAVDKAFHFEDPKKSTPKAPSSERTVDTAMSTYIDCSVDSDVSELTLGPPPTSERSLQEEQVTDRYTPVKSERSERSVQQPTVVQEEVRLQYTPVVTPSVIPEEEESTDFADFLEESSFKAPEPMPEPTKPLPPMQVKASVGGGTELWISNPETSGCSTTHLRSSCTDPGDIQRVTLRLLRGKQLPAEASASLRIYLNDVLEVAQISMQEADPIWGGTLYSFPLEAVPSFDELVFVWSAYGLDGKVRVPLSKLMAATEPTGKGCRVNHWVKLSAGGGGKIQLRVSPTPEDAVLHPQETCPTLTPGPAIPDHLKASYAMRKQILYGTGTPVILNVYDCGTSATISNTNTALRSMGYGGMFHAGVQIHGREYSFGGTRCDYNGTGIFTNPPKECTLHHYRESVYLGDCELTRIQIAMVVLQMQNNWKAKSYNLFRHNCCFFSQALARELGVGDLPEWVYSLAQQAEKYEPTLNEVGQYVQERRKAREQAAAEAAARPDEAMLDHVMAARIQRSVRRRSVQRRQSVGRK